MKKILTLTVEVTVRRNYVIELPDDAQVDHLGQLENLALSKALNDNNFGSSPIRTQVVDFQIAQVEE